MPVTVTLTASAHCHVFGPGLSCSTRTHESLQDLAVFSTSGTNETSSLEGHCPGQCSVAVKRHHDHGNSYKRQHLVRAGLDFHGFGSLSSWQEARGHMGRCGS